MQRSQDYIDGLIDAQKVADRIAGNSRDFTDRERKGAGMVSAEIRSMIEQVKSSESAATTSDV